MELRLENLSNLKCVLCKNYLSVSPILINTFCENICGRCCTEINENADGKFYIRNKTFEDLAAAILFPCKYQPNGCKLKLTMETMKIHESICKFQENVYICPLENNNNGFCKWSGNLTEIEHHFEKCHPINIANHPFQKFPDVTKFWDLIYLLKVDGFLFLLKVLTDPKNNEISFKTLLFGHPSLAKLFSSSVLIFNSANTLMKSSDVYPYKTNGGFNNDGIKLFISHLKQDFGNFDNFSISLRITIKEVSCTKCKKILSKAPIYTSEENFLCSECHLSKTNHTCKNRGRGCNFENPEYFLLRKHEYWLCKYRDSKCRWCDKKLVNISTLEHYEDSHDVIVKAEVSNNNATYSFKLSLRSYSYIICAHNMKFRMFVNFTKTFLHISFLTDSIDKSADFFHVHYILIRGDNCINGKLQKRTPESLNNYWLVVDYHENIFLPQTFISKATKNNDIKLELNIMKNFIC